MDGTFAPLAVPGGAAVLPKSGPCFLRARSLTLLPGWQSCTQCVQFVEVNGFSMAGPAAVMLFKKCQLGSQLGAESSPQPSHDHATQHVNNHCQYNRCLHDRYEYCGARVAQCLDAEKYSYLPAPRGRIVHTFHICR